MVTQKHAIDPQIIDQINQFRQLLKPKYQVDQIILFGSQAKGKAKTWSDYDLCVVSPSFTDNRFDLLIKLGDIASKINLDFEPHPMHPDDLNNPYSTLATEIKKYGIVIEET